MSTRARTAARGGPGPYVVTFAVSFERMPLAVPFLHELDHFSAFRSHTIEDGRSVFRLHVGYYRTEDAARAALRVVRRHYTDAHVATAPHRDAGSLDDTGITEFTMAWPADAGGATPAHRTAADAALQRYAIQLEALARADAAGSGPDLELFHAHTLYRVHVLLEDVLHQALRLGFFASVAAAQEILVHLRDAYPKANIVPVSGREYSRIQDLAPPAVAGAGVATRAAEPVTRGGRAMPPAAVLAFESDDDVSCEFGAHELPTTERGAPFPPRRGSRPGAAR